MKSWAGFYGNGKWLLSKPVRHSHTAWLHTKGASGWFATDTGRHLWARADLAHPLAYGYNQRTVSLFKANEGFLEKSKSPYATPFYYDCNPLQRGWVSKQNLDAIKTLQLCW